VVRFGGKRREISRERFWLFIRHTTLSSHYYFYTNESIFQLFLLLSPALCITLTLKTHKDKDRETESEKERTTR
jgi:hypothetical protein